MTNTVIDETTGLPDLPENLLWRVVPYEGTLSVQIVKEVEELREVGRKYVVPKKLWWGVKTKTETTVEKVKEYDTQLSMTMRDVKTFSFLPSSDWARKNKEYYEWYDRISKEDLNKVKELQGEGWRINVGFACVYVYMDWEPTKENVLKAAEICMKKYTADREEKLRQAQHKQMVESLVGVYPPKKLD